MASALTVRSRLERRALGEVRRYEGGESHLNCRSLRHSSLFPRLLQALIETCRAGKQSDQCCAILDNLSNHLGGLGPPGFQQFIEQGGAEPRGAGAKLHLALPRV